MEIFRLLGRYRYLRSTYIHAFAGGASQTRFKERLGDLFHEGFIDRPAQQWGFANCRHVPVVYETGRGAQQILRERGTGNPELATFLSGMAHRQFLHSLMICEILASLELDIRARRGLRFITWPQILARAPEHTRASATPFRIAVPTGGYLVPDGLFGIEYATGEKKSYRFFALEADRGTMPVMRTHAKGTSILGKIAAYRDTIIQQRHRILLGIPNLLVLTVTTSTVRVPEITDRLREKTGESAAFLFKAITAPDLTTPLPQLLCEPWHRAGFPPLCIGE